MVARVFAPDLVPSRHNVVQELGMERGGGVPSPLRHSRRYGKPVGTKGESETEY